ncbi:hypothetical protein D3C72_1052390 [compost metagenome]
MNSSTTRLLGYAGLVGACAMFGGDMLFYGQWGTGADALAGSLEVVRRADSQRLAIGGFASIIGGFGYSLGACHVYGRMASQSAWLRVLVAAGFLAIAVIATATHAVWGSFALSVASGTPDASLIADYLSLHFVIGGLVGGPASVLLLGAIVLRRTDWPVWFAAVSPGAIYVLLSTAAYLPAPFGAVIVGGAFNLAFVLFYGVSVALPPYPPHSDVR